MHLGYRWFLGYDFDVPTPNHSVLSRARVRFGAEVFEEFFRRSIDLCREAGLLEEGPVYVDSTLIQAAAAVDSLVWRDSLVQPPLSITEYVQRLYAENAPAVQDEEPPPPPGAGAPRGAVVVVKRRCPGPIRRSKAGPTQKPPWSTGRSSGAISPTRRTSP